MSDRMDFFKDRPHNRFWWHHDAGHNYLPALYGSLDDRDWRILTEWYTETHEKSLWGEAGIPLLSVLQGFVMGSGIDSIVQCGHYAGYSSLLLGFMLRRMGRRRGLFSIDIDKEMTDYTTTWLKRAELDDYVTLACGDSADPEMPARAKAVFGKPVSTVLIDSSHQYEHTLRELDLWYGALRPNGLMFLHDTSEFAAGYDSTKAGGVKRAIIEWTAKYKRAFITINPGFFPLSELVYGDGCGVGIIQKT